MDNQIEEEVSFDSKLSALVNRETEDCPVCGRHVEHLVERNGGFMASPVTVDCGMAAFPRTGGTVNASSSKKTSPQSGSSSSLESLHSNNSQRELPGSSNLGSRRNPQMPYQTGVKGVVLSFANGKAPRNHA
jgi:hypothetical protein